jgi:hypothetical protein
MPAIDAQRSTSRSPGPRRSSRIVSNPRREPGTSSVASSSSFAFIADVRNDPRWHTDVLEARLIEDAVVDKGSTFEITTKPVMGMSGGTVTV